MIARCRDDEGRITLLILGLTVLVLTLIVGIVGVTSVHLSRMRMLDAADSAALDATDEHVGGIYREGTGEALPLDDAIVQQAAARSIEQRGLPQGVESWAVAPGTGSPDGSTAVVRLTGEVDIPLVGGLLKGLGGSVSVTVESRARAIVEEPS